MTLEQLFQTFGTDHGSLATFGIAFLGGIVSSAVCPCTLPVGLGMASVAGASESRLHYTGLQISAAFFLGIVSALTALGAFVGQIGALATESFGRNWALVMAALSLIAAVVVFRWSRMNFDKLIAWRRPGLVGTFGYGVIFSLGTSVGPLLLLLSIAATGRSYGPLLMAFAFGIGRGLPFLLAGIAGSALTSLTRLGSMSRAIQLVSVGALLIVSAYYTSLFVALL